jgi:hypothetical protein
MKNMRCEAESTIVVSTRRTGHLPEFNRGIAASGNYVNMHDLTSSKSKKS